MERTTRGRNAPDEEGARHNPEYISVREKIFQVQHDPSSVRGAVRGPEIDFFFHELKGEEPTLKRFTDIAAGLTGTMLLVLLSPVLTLLAALGSRGSVIARIPTVGKSGRLFNRYEFRISDGDDANRPNGSAISRVLHSTGLYRLPACINLLKGEISLVGPQMYAQDQNVRWNSTFDQFYKRHAVKPGLLAVCDVEGNQSEHDLVEQQLRKEFRYITSPSITTDLKVLTGRF